MEKYCVSIYIYSDNIMHAIVLHIDYCYVIKRTLRVYP